MKTSKKSYLAEFSDNLAKIINNAEDSVVEVLTIVKEEDSWYNRLRFLKSEEIITRSGAGFFIDKSGFIITNHHVTDEAEQIAIRVYDYKVYEAKLVGSDPVSDIALLKVDDVYFKPIKLNRRKIIKKGEIAIAIGHPLNYYSSASLGIVSHPSRIDFSPDSGYPLVYIQTDASINSGNSGGPLLNCEGSVIGVNTLSYNPGNVENIAFAIPISKALKIADKLKRGIKLKYGTMGIVNAMETDIHGEVLKYNKLKQKKGLEIFELEEGGPAHNAGIGSFDIILKVNDKPVYAFDDLLDYMYGEYVGQSIKLDVLEFVGDDEDDETSGDDYLYSVKKVFVELLS